MTPHERLSPRDRSDWSNQELLQWMLSQDWVQADSRQDHASSTNPSQATTPRIEDIFEALRASQLAVSAELADSGFDPSTNEPQTAKRGDHQQPVWSKRFEVVRHLGRGGFGIVFLARDLQLDREVAIKIPRPDVLYTRESLQRLLREAKNAAILHHPNIVPVFGIEPSFPLPALVYHYCSGPTLAAWFADRGKSVDARTVAQIVLLLADAVQHAHARGILHRDLKPGNVLLDATEDHTVTSGIPDGDDYWIPRIIDFGISKVLDEQRDITGTGIVLGTPAYMSPEQAAGETDEVGTHSDIYSLGAILYELLAGQPPFIGRSSAQVMLQIQIRDPDPIRRIRKHVSPELEAIALKCLQKDYRLRYTSAAALADDLRNFLAGRSVTARPASVVERTCRWMRRQPALASLVGVCILSVVAAISGALLHFQRIAGLASELATSNRQLDLAAKSANQNAQELRSHLYASDIALAHQALQNRDLRTFHSLLHKHVPAAGEEDIRDLAWWQLDSLGHRESTTVTAFDGPAYCVRISRDGRYLAACSADGTLQFFSLPGERHLGTIKTAQGEVNGISFSNDSRWLATAGDDGTVRVWDRATLEQVRRIEAHDDLAYDAIFTPNDQMLISCGNDPVIRIWNVETGELEGELVGHERAIDAIAISRDGSTLLSASADHTCREWNLARRTETSRKVCQDRANAVCFNGEETGFFVGTNDGAVSPRELFSEEPGMFNQAFPTMNEGVCDLEVVPTRNQLVVAARDGMVRIVDLGSGNSPTSKYFESAGSDAWYAHQGRAYSIAITPRGDAMYSAGEDGLIMRWSLASKSPWRTFDLAASRDFPEGYTTAVLPRSNRLLVACRKTGEMFVWNPRDSSFRNWTKLSPLAVNLAVSPDESCMAVGYNDGRLQFWDNLTGGPKLRWTLPGTSEDGDDVRAMAIAQRGEWIVAANEKLPYLRQLDGETGAEIGRYPFSSAWHVNCLAVSPDNATVAAGQGRNVLVWARDSQQPQVFRGHMSGVNCVAFDPNGNKLVSCSSDRTIRLWDLSRQIEEALLEGHRTNVQSVFFTSDGRNLLSAAVDGSVKLWHVPTRKELHEFLRFRSSDAYLGAVTQGWMFGAFDDDRVFALPLPGRDQSVSN